MSRNLLSYFVIFFLTLSTFLPYARVISHIIPFAILLILIAIYPKVELPKVIWPFVWLLVLSIISAIYNTSHYINFLLGFNTWFVGVVTLVIAYTLGEYINILTYFRFILLLSLIQIPIGLYQIFSIVEFQTLNPFKIYASAGDMFSGTMLLSGVNSHVLGIKMLFTLLLVYFIPQITSLNRAIVLFSLIIGWILPSAIHSFLCFFSAVLTYILVVRKNLKVLFRVFVFLGLAFSFILLTQEFAFEYVENLITSSINLDKAPRKVLYLYSTLFELTPEKPHVAVLGLGLGRYSSYGSMAASGELLRFDFMPVVISPETQKYIIPLWNKVLIRIDEWKEGVANQPWFTYMSLYGELGLTGLILFIFFWFKIILILKKEAVKSTFVYAGLAHALLLYTFTLMNLYFFDNWFEDPRLMIPYFITLGIFLKHIKARTNSLRTNTLLGN